MEGWESGLWKVEMGMEVPRIQGQKAHVEEEDAFCMEKSVICLTIVWIMITHVVTSLSPFSRLVSPLGHCLIH